MTKHLYIETVGCQMNVLDSELVVAALRDQGYDLTDDAQQADTILFNTCSVREHAEDKTYSALGRMKRLKRKSPEKVIKLAVKGMLPRSPLGRAMFKKLKVYAGAEHPHGAQQPQAVQL